MKTRTRLLLAASLAGVLASPLVSAPNEAKAGKESKSVHCYGVNKCKGVGDCGTQGNSCHGTNACKRQGFIEMDEATCLKLDGGRLTAEESAGK